MAPISYYTFLILCLELRFQILHNPHHLLHHHIGFVLFIVPLYYMLAQKFF